MGPVLHGILFGGLLTILVGATFFVLMDTSINRGFWHAMYLELGIVLSDLTLIFLLYFTTTELLQNLINNQYFKICGGIIFIGFGNYYLFKHYHLRKKNAKKDKINFIRLFLNGFFVNIFNPSVPAFWIGAMIVAVSHYKYQGTALSTFFISSIATMFGFDIIKIYYASKLSKIINPKFLKKLYIFTGGILIILGIRIIFF